MYYIVTSYIIHIYNWFKYILKYHEKPLSELNLSVFWSIIRPLKRKLGHLQKENKVQIKIVVLSEIARFRNTNSTGFLS